MNKGELLKGECYVARLGQPLTKRQKQIYSMIVDDALEAKEIAKMLSLSPRTIKFHKHNIYIKLGVKTCLELVVRHYKKIQGE